ncbi:hypothetical protein DYB28_000319 [Aphanomyces astaci]|uniref:Uncharacterized protein n=1 Tax=Aphanomyces astaci TaxID=112090 RepID=A0A9X8E171_APHAT|nr:hypothetical protein DYB28_000319 [Aphanomyces astaci]
MLVAAIGYYLFLIQSTLQLFYLSVEIQVVRGQLLQHLIFISQSSFEDGTMMTYVVGHAQFCSQPSLANADDLILPHAQHVLFADVPRMF